MKRNREAEWAVFEMCMIGAVILLLGKLLGVI